MADKPTEKPDWVNDDGATKIKEPSASKKLTGFLEAEMPPFNFLNWVINIFSHWLNYFSGNAQYNIIIDSDTDEGDYTSMAAYLADSPAAGDRVLVKVDEVLTATLSIPAGIEITQLKGKKFTLTTDFSPIINFNSDVKTKGDFRIENSDTGTIAKAFSTNGDDNHHDNLIIENVSTGTITDGVYIEAGAEGNYAQSRSINSGGGAITNDLTDNSGNDENHVTVRGDAGISRSRGAKKFDQPDIADLTNVQHAHDDTVGGGDLAPKFKLVSKTANYTATPADSVILVDATSGPVTITLPTAVGINGKVYTTKKIDSSGNDVIVDGAGAETIDGETTYKLYTRYDSVEIISNNSNWMKIGENFGKAFEVFTFTRDQTLASGNQAVTGIGFKPKAIFFLAAQSSSDTAKASWGYDFNADSNCIYDNHGDVANSYIISTTRSIYALQSSGNAYLGDVSSMDNDGFTISWTKTGAPSGTLRISYLAMR